MSRSRRCSLRASALILVLVAVTPAPARSQSLWLQREAKTSLFLEVLKPSLELIKEEFPTGVVFLGARHEITPATAVVAELPYVAFKGTFDIFIGSPEVQKQSGLGNPYLGIEVSGSDSPFFLELGGRIPVTADDEFGAAITGQYTDQVRTFAFVPDYVPLQAAVNLRATSESGVVTRLRFGPTVLIPTEGSSDTELFGVYAWVIGHEGSSLRIGSALSGSVLVTEDSGNLGARTRNQLEVHADFGQGRIRPGLELKLPFGSPANLVPVVLGFSLGVSL